ncbi:NAD-dependent epimerase/dehydratase family protein [Paucilactobacillus hokkaidonensis JCM 18461]|uniref:NAD-dependent epimerase/dehydratase family protein n=2 Tax=Paucilactobacillus hokkaidonensis TaxID=1193095 RepID=A0A0A1GWG0_9LACO|nr:aldehyde reductase [Paucilactobacillus hokkaidonensis]BAP84701.1 NAD-dependent epimerase/dehydratase family protein [Paucilactobacillus hokkaidonensis JCM 18461]
MKQTVLVTGGNGFLGLNIIAQLLTHGYAVRTTLRNLDKQTEVINTLKQNKITGLDQLNFVQADLSQDAGWNDAMQGITYVLSVASPVFMDIPRHPEEMDQAAKKGIIRILKAADAAQVTRIVMTANFGAVGFSNKNKQSITTEADWTNPDEPGLSPYEKSKLLAEQAAWQFIKSTNSAMEFTTINPVAILGPSLNQHISGSFGIIKGIVTVTGSMKRLPNIALNVIDVRDVADLHIRAMTDPKANGQRFIASADGQISFPEIANLIRRQRPQLAKRISTKTMPDWLINVAAPFSKQAKEAQLLLQMNRHVSNQKAKKFLNWQPANNNEAVILATVDYLAKYSLLD